MARRKLPRVIADSVYHAMYRIAWPDGSLSDLLNRSRAHDAVARWIVLHSAA